MQKNIFNEKRKQLRKMGIFCKSCLSPTRPLKTKTLCEICQNKLKNARQQKQISYISQFGQEAYNQLCLNINQDKRSARERNPINTWLQRAAYFCNRRTKELNKNYKRVNFDDMKAIYERDNKQCIDCGTVNKLTIAHRIPLFYNIDEIDLNGAENLFLQCGSCNSKQHNSIHPTAGEWKLVRCNSL